jgi:dethiobiotin synthetase
MTSGQDMTTGHDMKKGNEIRTPLPPQLVVCGTDTDVGKTVVSALLVQGLGAHYWKPVQSGIEHGGDSGSIQALLGLPAERICPESYRLNNPVSPHWAAELDGLRIEP